MKENLAVLDFELEPDEMSALEELEAEHRLFVWWQKVCKSGEQMAKKILILNGAARKNGSTKGNIDNDRV